MRPTAIHLYVGAVTLVGLLALGLQDWQGAFDLPPAAFVGFVCLVLLGFLFEATALRFPRSSGTTSSSITWLPVIACVLLFGPAPAVVLLTLSGALAEFAIRKKELLRATFNLAQFVVAATGAGAAFSLSGGLPLAGRTDYASVAGFDPQLLPFVVFTLALLLLNHLLVAGAIALSQHQPVGRVFRDVTRKLVSSLPTDILISPLSLLVAFLYIELGVTGLVVSLLPLVFVRYSYLSKHQLEEANRDLLKVLVKAIETRDPYTSGHSMRVMELAGQIAIELGLPEREVEHVRTAALLHDIGKIELVYEGILKKTGALSERERKLMESHVNRGVDILTSLSSFNEKVIAAVRHHHESVDGNGYPSRLQGDDIPLGARIIKVCDAIDAMLSDRPYRSALSGDEVRLQLRQYSGTQFDHRVVKVALETDMIDRHIEHMAATDELGLRGMPRLVPQYQSTGRGTPERSAANVQSVQNQQP